MSSNSNRKPIHPYLIVGSLTALGGVALGVASSWIFNKFTKNKHGINCPTTHHVQILSNDDSVTRTDGVYIQEDEEEELNALLNAVDQLLQTKENSSVKLINKFALNLTKL